MATRMNKKTESSSSVSKKTTATKSNSRTVKTDIHASEEIAETKSVNDIASVEYDESIKAKETVKEKKVFNATDSIKCYSVVQGSLFMEGAKTGMVYRFIEYGDYCEIEYRDLVAAIRSKSGFIFNPWIIIDDEDFIEQYPQIEKFYANQYSSRDLRAILRLDLPDMMAAIEKLPKTAIDNLKVIVSTQIANGDLDSLKKIKALDEYFGTQLSLLNSVLND